MRALARSLYLAGTLLPASCAMPGQRGGGSAHPDFNTELVLNALEDVDYLMTNYAWVLALLGL